MIRNFIDDRGDYVGYKQSSDWLDARVVRTASDGRWYACGYGGKDQSAITSGRGDTAAEAVANAIHFGYQSKDRHGGLEFLLHYLESPRRRIGYYGNFAD